MAVYSFDLEGRFREIAHRSISTGGELTEQTILETAVSYVTDDYLPALFNEHHGIPAWSKPKYREGNALLDTNELASSWVGNVSGANAEVGSDCPYVGTQSEGATIKAKNKSGLLWIPNRAVLGPSEARAMTTKEAIAKFKLHRRGRTLQDKKGTVYYFGTPQVTIPPRPIMAGIPNPVFDEGMGMTMRALIAAAWDDTSATA